MATAPAPYPRRLIEVDLPIRQISEHARREKSIRHGHISTLHLWWARRPLAACRAVILASLWPDPVDSLCPEAFREAARRELRALRDKRGGHPYEWNDNLQLRRALLAFIADFANWDLINDPDYLATSRAIVSVAHEMLGGEPGTRPLVVDPFAGGGAIPLEAIRVGADAFAGDLNPVAVTLNKVVLEYIPKYGQRLAAEVHKWGTWIRERTEKELAEFYPVDPDGNTPVAYLWARTIKCEGPSCGVVVPLLRTLILADRSSEKILLVPSVVAGSIRIDIQKSSSNPRGGETVQRGAVTCPVCQYTTKIDAVRRQLLGRSGGTADARLLAVVTRNGQGKHYRLPNSRDEIVVRRAETELVGALQSDPRFVPSELISTNELRRVSAPLYGMTRWRDVFLPRQLLTLGTLHKTIASLPDVMPSSLDAGLREAITVCVALAVSRASDFWTSATRWIASGEKIGQTFSRQALPMVWDFVEGVPFGDISGSVQRCLEYVTEAIEHETGNGGWPGRVAAASATSSSLGDDDADAWITDPPYYDAIPYAHLSDFFFVWLKRSLGRVLAPLFQSDAVPKEQEIVVDRAHSRSTSVKGVAFYERELAKAFSEHRRVVRHDGIGLVVFASKSTASWEAVLHALVGAGWVVTGSWPIDTERDGRLAAIGQARLGSSVHIVVRPRENSDGTLRVDAVGDWDDVLDELPRRIAAWLPRLAAEGVVGADAIFACLGPALEIFSRYSRVEKASGEVVPLREYLERVWGEVARQALSMIFAGADTSGFEQDARLTAMWLWTLSTNRGGAEESDDEEAADDEEDAKPAGKSKGGFGLEYDAARKIAQGLGASLESLTTLVEVKGDSARLLGVGERESALFPKKGAAKVEAPAAKKAKKAQLALALGDTTPTTEAKKTDVAAEPEELAAPAAGGTMLDRVHQAMLMFRAGRSAAMKRFLVEDGVGREERFWKLAQALSALYPAGTEEKRWVDGVLARKKGLGL